MIKNLFVEVVSKEDLENQTLKAKADWYMETTEYFCGFLDLTADVLNRW